MMGTSEIKFDMSGLQQSWLVFNKIAHLRPIHNEEQYAHIVSLMNTLLDVVGDDEDHALARQIAA